MKIVVTKAVCELINGDRKVINDKVVVATDLESYRKQIFKVTPNCRTVRFTYEELPD
ncbi:hypothetical protein [Proteiniphilum acetatigenes]|uniref:hypothetical protein n=1 Tax=Proteiniphilum acetatigenes TaxID=294710 RepID=UPI0012FC62E6|nr:hypothetical protein [Proteiniphilum acetatigenes]